MARSRQLEKGMKLNLMVELFPENEIKTVLETMKVVM